MKNEEQIRKRIQDLKSEQKNIKKLQPGCDPEEAQNNVYQHKSILNQLSALNWVLDNPLPTLK